MGKEDRDETRTPAGRAPDARTQSMVQCFTNAYAIFNRNSDPSIGGLLDENVTVFSVSANRPVVGRAAVENYFKQQFSDCPQFQPLEPFISNTSGNTGTIAGSARWVDTNGAETISFVFTFVVDSSGQWKILSLWGS